MQLPLLTRAPVAAHKGDSVPLKVRLRQIHRHRRRAFIRRVVKSAWWSAAILSTAAFGLALTLGLAQR